MSDVLKKAYVMADFEDKLVSAELTVPIQITNEFDVDRDGTATL